MTVLTGGMDAGGGRFGDVDQRLADLARQALAAVNTDDQRRAPVSSQRAEVLSERGVVTGNVAQLSEGQRDCLRLVYRHMTSKDIARTLGVSPHTVDMRLRTAMKTLGVDSRIDAARLLDEYENGTPGYQPLIYQSSELSNAGDAANVVSPASATSDEYAVQHSDIRPSPDFGPPAYGPPHRSGAPSPDKGVAHFTPGSERGLGYVPQFNQSVPWGDRNTLGSGPRLAWIAVIAIGSALGFGAILGALEALKHLL